MTETTAPTLTEQKVAAERRLLAAQRAFMVSIGGDPISRAYLDWVAAIRDYDDILAGVAAEQDPRLPAPGRVSAAYIPSFADGLNRAMTEATRAVMRGAEWPPEE